MKLDIELLKDAFEIVNKVPRVATFETTQIMEVESKNETLSLRLSGIVVGEAELPVKENAKDFILYVERRAFSSFLNSIPSKGDLVLTPKSEAMVMKKGRKVIELQTNTVISGYESWDFKKAKKVSLSDEALLRMNDLRDYVSDAPGSAKTYAIACSKAVGMFATDGLQLCAFLDQDVPDLLVPPLLSKFTSFSNAVIRKDSSGMGVRVVHGKVKGYLYQSLPSDIEQMYPKEQIEGYLDAGIKEDPTFILPIKEFEEVCSNLTQYKGSVQGEPYAQIEKDSTKGIKFTLTLISGEATDYLKATQEDESQPNYKVFLPLLLLEKWLKVLPENTDKIYCACLPSALSFYTEDKSTVFISAIVSTTETVEENALSEEDVDVAVDDDDVPF